MELSRKGQMDIRNLSGFAIALLLVGIVVVIAFLILGSFSSTVNETQTTNTSSVTALSNSQGAVNSTGLNDYINSYVNVNVSGYKNDTSANFTATAPSTIWIKVYINGTATTTAYQKAKVSNATYSLTAGKTLYKMTTASNDTAYKNVTEYLKLNTNYYTYTIALSAGGVEANTSIGQVSNAFGTIASYLPLIALVVVAGIIIGMVVLSFGGRRKEESKE